MSQEREAFLHGMTILVVCLGVPLEAGLCGEKKAEETPVLYPVRLGGKAGYIDRTGKMVVEPRFEYGDGFYEGLAMVSLDGKYGFIDGTGEFVIGPAFARAWNFSEGLAIVKVDQRYGFLDKTGKMAIKPMFPAVHHFSDGLAAVKSGGKWGFINRQARVVIRPAFEGVGPFKGDLACVTVQGKRCYIDRRGTYVWFDSRRVGHRKKKAGAPVVLYPAEKQHLTGYIDQTGTMVIPARFRYARSFHYGLAAVERNGKWGFIDPSGKTVVELQFDFAGDFCDGLARVKKDYKLGFIDTAGKFAIPPTLEFASSFHNGLALATGPKESGYIDKTGRFVWRQSVEARKWCKVRTRKKWLGLLAEVEPLLESGNESKRLDAVKRLGNADYIGAVKRLVEILKETNAELARLEEQVAEIFGKIREIVGEGKEGESRIPPARAGEVASLRKEAAEVREKSFAVERFLGATVVALGRARDATPTEWLVKAPVRDPAWRNRKGVAEALGSIPENEAVTEALVRLSADPVVGVRVAAVDGLGGRRDGRAFEALVKALADGAWRVRAGAIAGIGKAGDPVKIADVLIPALEKEDGRLRGDIDRTLEKVTGRSFGADFDLWSSWWSVNRKKFVEGGGPGSAGSGKDAGSGGGKTVAFYGVRTFSKHIVFVIDISVSMDSPARRPPGWRPDIGSAGAGPEGGTKIALAKRELKQAIAALPEDGTFNVICFNFDVTMLSPCMVRASRAGKMVSYRWIDALTTGQGSDIFRALAHAFHLVERPEGGHVSGAGKTKDTVADTVFFLSDGHGPYPEATLAAVRQWNRWRRMIVHAIGIGRDNKAFMGTLASENGGRYVNR